MLSCSFANLKGAYTESLAKSDTAGNTIIDLKHINKGGIDYAAKEGNILKIVESKARQSLMLKDLKNYIKTDNNGIATGFNIEYVINELGKDYFNPNKNPNLRKQFVLYLNGPNSQVIKSSLNLPSSLPYKYKTKTDEFIGSIEIVVMAVNK